MEDTNKEVLQMTWDELLAYGTTLPEPLRSDFQEKLNSKTPVSFFHHETGQPIYIIKRSSDKIDKPVGKIVACPIDPAELTQCDSCQ